MFLTRPRLHFAELLRPAGLILALLLQPAARSAATPETEKFVGQIRAVRVIGDVDAIDDDDQTVTPLHNGDLLYEHYTVVTREQASVVLVFSNGATLRLMPDTKLDILRFLQAPFEAEELDAGKLSAEPSTSTTNLKLEYGELVGQVAKLRTGSSHEIETPVGAAGIRGTEFRHFYQTEPNGLVRYALDTAAGLIEFRDLDGRRTRVPAGQEFGGAGRMGRFRRRLRLRLQSIPPHARFVLEHHLREIRAAAARVRFHRAEGRFQNTVQPKIKRDPEARRDTDDDVARMEQEERQRAERPPPPPRVREPRK